MRVLIFFASIVIALMLNLLTHAAQPDGKCQIVYDAGSSGTRIYAFQNQNGQVTQVFPLDKNEKEKSKVGIGISWAIEEKNCGDHICTNLDIKNAVQKITDGLIQIKKERCPKGLGQVLFYSTAGMRLAEIKGGRTDDTYVSIKEILVDKLGDAESIETKTLSGIEEGVFSWLALNTLRKTEEVYDSKHWGILEIGGASAQMVYPCEDCDESRTVKVKVDGEIVDLFAYSWLGLGRDQAFRIANEENGKPCSSVEDGGQAINKNNDSLIACKQAPSLLVNKNTVYDPLNFSVADESPRGAEITVKIPENTHFWGVGGLGYSKLQEDDLMAQAQVICGISEAQLKADQEKIKSKQTPINLQAANLIKYTPNRLIKSECFARYYFNAFLNLLPNRTKMRNEREIKGKDIGWTLGAAICSENDCLMHEENNIVCRWNLDLQCRSL